MLKAKSGALIIVPTRELAIQIGQHLEGLSYFTNISSISVFGGNDGGILPRKNKPCGWVLISLFAHRAG